MPSGLSLIFVPVQPQKALPMIATAQTFYKTLAANNTRDWWEANRGTYDKVLKPFALALLEDLSAPLAEIAGEPVKGKLFRPHRDVRFAKDKSPYNTHLHMMWDMQVEVAEAPVFFFGIGTDYVTAGAGRMGFDKPMLEDWRKFVDLDTRRVQGIIAGIAEHGFSLREPALKRVPSGFAADHPAGDLLRMKGCVATKDIGVVVDIQGALLAAFREVAPLNALLLQVAEA